VLLECIFGLVDVLSIVLRGRPSGFEWSRGATIYPDPGRIRRLLPQSPPRVFTIELYYAHLSGATPEEISERLEVPVDWVADRIEAARECVEFELPTRKST